MRFLLLTILALPIFLCAGDLNLGNLEKVELKGFQTNGVTEIRQNGIQNQLTWTICGDNALVQKPNYDLTGFQMILEDAAKRQLQAETYRIHSPHCLYNQDTHFVRSDSAFQLEGPDGLSISGIGYDIYLEGEKKGLRIVIRDAVRIDFQLGVLQKWRTQTQQ